MSYYDLGVYSRPVSTDSATAQQWFDRGLIWSYSFNHFEAVRCFRRAIEVDPHCAMAHWGIAYSIGPYYNKQWVRFDPTDLKATLRAAHEAAHEALRLCEARSEISSVERALIEAIVKRYAQSTPPDDFDQWNDDYADAMREVYRSFPDDLDVSALFVDAMMNRTPWALWDLGTGEPAENADTLECVQVVENAFDGSNAVPANAHPGLLHVYVHLLEMSPTPEKALKAADRLRHVAPESGHLNHMPTHIDVQCGDYQEVVTSNSRAIEADTTFMDKEGAWDSFYLLSYAHNLHFKLYGAMLLGQYQAAKEAADGLAHSISESYLRVESPPMADWLEGYIAMNVHALIRFGRWEDILAQPKPTDSELYCSTIAMQHYARTIAYAVLKDVARAQAERTAFYDAVQRVPESRRVFNNTCRDILDIAAQMLEGEVKYRAGDFAKAFAHLRRAVILSDQLPYDEPWGWMQPARHALGALLLEQNHVEEAEAVYREDLGLDDRVHRPCRHPDNVWSLHGYHECLVRLGKTEVADLIKPRLTLALARTDVPIKASCLCRLKTAA